MGAGRPLIRKGWQAPGESLLRLALANRMIPIREDLAMPDAIARQLEAYHRLRPKIVEEKRAGWVLIAHEELIEVFDEFDKASIYADEHFSNEQVLIRHTSEEKGIAPFIVSRQ
jgi:hypothetical protein